MVEKEKVLFLCTHNSVRSQMAEGILRHLAGDKYEVKSAGTHPCGVNPYAGEVLDEIGIDISCQFSSDITEVINEEFDYVITVCDKAKQTCPVFPGDYKKIHWSLKDPGEVPGRKDEIVSAFRETRNILKALILYFLKDKLEYANLKCPFCKSIQKIEIPKNKCLVFTKCKCCGKIISAQRGSCCLICSYSDKVCREFLAATLRND